MLFARYFSYFFLVIIFSSFLFSRTAEAKRDQREVTTLLTAYYNYLVQQALEAQSKPALAQELTARQKEIQSLMAMLIRAAQEKKDPLFKKENRDKSDTKDNTVHVALGGENTGKKDNILSSPQQKDLMAFVKAVEMIISEKDEVIRAQRKRICDLEAQVKASTQESATSSSAERPVPPINFSSFEITQDPGSSLPLSEPVIGAVFPPRSPVKTEKTDIIQQPNTFVKPTVHNLEINTDINTVEIPQNQEGVFFLDSDDNALDFQQFQQWDNENKANNSHSSSPRRIIIASDQSENLLQQQIKEMFDINSTRAQEFQAIKEENAILTERLKTTIKKYEQKLEGHDKAHKEELQSQNNKRLELIRQFKDEKEELASLFKDEKERLKDEKERLANKISYLKRKTRDYTSLKQQNEELEQEVVDLETELKTRFTTQGGDIDDINRLQERLPQQELELLELQSQNNSLTQDNHQKTQTIEELTDAIGTLKEAVQSLTTQLRSAQDENQEKIFDFLVKKVFDNTPPKIARYKRRYSSLKMTDWEKINGRSPIKKSIRNEDPLE